MSQQRPLAVPNTEGLRVVPVPSTRSRPVKPRNKFEAAALKVHSSLKLPDDFFPTDEEIDAELDSIDAEFESEETEILQRNGKKRTTSRSYQPYEREARRARYHREWDEIFANCDTLKVWGLKPHDGDLVHTVPIPNSSLTVRLWDSGLDDMSEGCLDFIDSSSLKAINSPEDWQLFPANHLGAISCPILSREELAGYKKNAIPPGEERFDIMRACCYVIRRPNHPDFLFEVPVKSTAGAAQARETRAVG